MSLDSGRRPFPSAPAGGTDSVVLRCEVRYLCPTSAPVPVSHCPARLRLLGDNGSGTYVLPDPRLSASEPAPRSSHRTDCCTSDAGVVVATRARRHLVDDDDRMDPRAKVSRAAPPTKGGEVLRIVDKHGSISFAGTGYRVGNRFIGSTVGVRLVGDTLQITLDGALLLDPSCLSRPHHGVRRPCSATRLAPEEPSWCRIGTGANPGHGWWTFTNRRRAGTITPP